MSEQSTVHPDGWIGNPAELERARRYRAALRWGMGPFWFLLIAYWVVFLTADDFVLESLIILAAGLLVVLGFYLRRKISEIIGRKWTFRLEQKERTQQDDPSQQRENEANPVGDWLSREAESDDE